MPLLKRSPWFVFGTLVAITLFATVFSLLLQRLFGGHPMLIALGPIVCVLGVLLFFLAGSRNGTRK
jgi:hypothetical protein